MVILRATECCFLRLRERTSEVVYLQIRGQKGNIVDKPDIRNYRPAVFYCAVVERTTDRQLQTSSGATSSQDEFTPVSEFGKRQEKAIRCQTEMCMR